MQTLIKITVEQELSSGYSIDEFIEDLKNNPKLQFINTISINRFLSLETFRWLVADQASTDHEKLIFCFWALFDQKVKSDIYYYEASANVLIKQDDSFEITLCDQSTGKELVTIPFRSFLLAQKFLVCFFASITQYNHLVDRALIIFDESETCISQELRLLKQTSPRSTLKNCIDICQKSYANAAMALEAASCALKLDLPEEILNLINPIKHHYFQPSFERLQQRLHKVYELTKKTKQQAENILKHSPPLLNHGPQSLSSAFEHQLNFPL